MRDYGANERGMGSEEGQPNVRRCHERSREDGATRADPQAVQEQPRAFLEETAKEPTRLCAGSEKGRETARNRWEREHKSEEGRGPRTLAVTIGEMEATQVSAALALFKP